MIARARPRNATIADNAPKTGNAVGMGTGSDGRRWLALAVLSLSMLVTVVDAP